MVKVDRKNLLGGLIVSATVVALSSVAATIDSIVGGVGERSSVSIEPRNPGGSGGNVSPNPGGNPPGEMPASEAAVDMTVCIEPLTTPLARIAIFAGAALLLYAIARRTELSAALLAGTALVPAIWGGYFFLTNCFGSGDPGGGDLLSGASAVSNTGSLDSPPLPPAVVAGFFGLLILGSVVMLVRTTGADETFEPIEEGYDEPSTSAFARAAGRAADRIEEANVPVDNAVYQAWLEMTALLDIENPESTAPRDFVGLATDVGLDEDDVAELAELFNEVRYGGKSAETREERAVEILRNVEETYREPGESHR